MPLPPIWEPDAELLDRTVKVRLSVCQLEHLDLAVKEFRMSRSRVLRESLALGFPLFVEKVRQRRRAGLAPRGEYQNPTAAGSVAWAAFGRAVCGPLGECAQGARASPVAEAGEVGLSGGECRRGVCAMVRIGAGKWTRHQEVYFSTPDD